MVTVDTQKSVYRFIRHFIETEGYAPSLREIAEGCYLSVGNVTRYLDRLELRGLIYREPGKARSIQLLAPDRDW
jgi:repressor LexA